MTIASPIDEHYLRHLMFTAQSAGRCFTIRYPRGRGSVINWCCPMQQIEIGKGRQLSEGSDIAVLSIGPIGKMVQKAIKSVRRAAIQTYHYRRRRDDRRRIRKCRYGIYGRKQLYPSNQTHRHSRPFYRTRQYIGTVYAMRNGRSKHRKNAS